MPTAKSTLALSLLLAWLAPPGVARAQLMPDSCQSFTRESSPAPAVVRAWLAHSSDDHVIVCAPGSGGDAPGATLYSGESRVGRQGAVCSYSSHGLTRVASGTGGRLQRYERGDAVRMAIAGRECPPPHSALVAERYTETYDLSPAAFVSIMELWSAAAAATQTFDQECCENRGAPGAARSAPASGATAQRLRAAIAAGRMKSIPVTRIVRITGLSLRRRYALFVADPDSQPPGSTLYVIYLSRWLAGTWHLTGVADAAD